jgi:hypothetical protein
MVTFDCLFCPRRRQGVSYEASIDLGIDRAQLINRQGGFFASLMEALA